MIKTIKNWARLDMAYLSNAGFWSSFEYVGSALLSIFSAVAFANLLPKETYGIYRYIFSLIDAVGILAISKLVDQAVTRAVAKGSDGALKYGVWLQLRWNLLFLAVALGLGGYYFVQGNSIFAAAIWIVGLGFYLKNALGTYEAFLVGKRDFRRRAFYALVLAAVNTLVVVATLFATDSLLAVIVAASLPSFVIHFIFYLQIIRPLKLATIQDTVKKEILRYSLHGNVIGAIAIILGQIDKILLFQFLGPAQLAIYSFATIIPDKIKGLTKVLANIVAPKLALKDLEEINRSFILRTIQGFLFGLLLAVVYIAMAPLIFRYLFPQYLDSLLFSQMLALVFVPALAGAYTGGANQAQGLIRVQYISASLNIFGIVLIIIGAFWGIVGVIAARIITSAMLFVIGIVAWKMEVGRILRLRGRSY